MADVVILEEEEIAENDDEEDTEENDEDNQGENNAHKEDNEPEDECAAGPSNLEQSAICNEGKSCSICFDDYTSAGPHRLVSLKCGHLFGNGCIRHWVNSHNKRNRAGCPTCKHKVMPKDIRPIFATRVQMTDTSDFERCKEQMTELRRENRQLNIDLAASNLRFQKQREEIDQLHIIMARQQSSSVHHQPAAPASRKRPIPGINGLLFDPDVFSTGATQSPSRHIEPPSNNDRTIQYRLEQNANIVLGPSADGCRAIDFQRNGQSNLLLATTQFPTVPLTNLNYGVKKFDMGTMRPCNPVRLHLKPVRDVESAESGMFLTASDDKTLRRTSGCDQRPCQTFRLSSTVWTCCHMGTSEYYVFAGTMSGKVLMYDLRMPTENEEGMSMPVTELFGGSGPVTRLKWTQLQSDRHSCSGLLVFRVNECIFFEMSPSDPTVFQPHFLGINGSMASSAFDAETNHILATFRPTAESGGFVQHRLYQLETEETSSEGVSQQSLLRRGVVGRRLGNSFLGGRTQTKLVRNSLFVDATSSGSDRRLLAAVTDETAQTVALWDPVVAAAPLTSVRLPVGPLMQISPVTVGGKPALAAISGKNLIFYSLSAHEL